MDFGLQGKVAMVAAASKGIGLATAQLLAAEGCQLSICARNEEVLEAAAGEISPETRSYVVDVSNAEDLVWWYEQTVQDLGHPAILVTNTGGPAAGTLDEVGEVEWSQGFESTLMNAVRLVGLVAPQMERDGWGRIVHITSLVAKQPSPTLPISSTLRAGLMALTRLQATRWAPHGVTVNAVLPGHTLTDRQRHLAERRAREQSIGLEEALDLQAQSVPMKRLADPKEIAAAVAFLCSIQASYITGTNLLVDGGAVGGLA
jgi:3-oxoacyl-[acyl-carrier protein] reductase